MIEVVLGLLVMLIGYGVSGSMRRFYFTKQSEEERNIFVSTNMILMFILVFIISFPAFFFTDQLAFLAFGKPGMGYFILLGLLNFWAEMTSQTAESYILIRQRSVMYFTLIIIKIFIILSLNIYFIVILKIGVMGYILSGLIGSIYFTITAHVFAFVNVGVHFNSSDAKQILKFSLPMLPGYLAAFIRSNSDRIFLRKYLGLAQLGAFEMLFKFATLIGIIIVEPFMKSWDVKRYEVCDTIDGPPIISHVFNFHLAIMLTIGLVLSLEIPLLLKILTPPEFWLGSLAALFAVTSRIINATYYHFFFGLLHAKETFKISIIQMVSALTSLVLNIILIKPFGVMGALIVSCVVASLQSFLAYNMSKKYYQIPFEWSKIILMTFLMGAVFIIINMVTISGTFLGTWIDHSISQPIRNILEQSSLQSLKNSKIIYHTLNNLILIIEGGIKFICSFIYPVLLIYLDIIPGKENLRKIGWLTFQKNTR